MNNVEPRRYDTELPVSGNVSLQTQQTFMRVIEANHPEATAAEKQEYVSAMLLQYHNQFILSNFL